MTITVSDDSEVCVKLDVKSMVYTKTQKIGNGACGDIFCVKEDDNTVVKQQSLDYMCIREMVSLLNLSHKNIVHMSDYICADKGYLLMDKASKTLSDLSIDELSEGKITYIIFQILQGVNYMHKHGIMHRDLKLNNILLYGNDVKICDFGCSKYHSLCKKSSMFHTQDVITLYNRPPEVSMKNP